MLAFTFPGQGSQRPGMGRPWVSHPSWELVADASDAAGRDIEALLLDAGPEELTATRNAQLATFVLSLVVLDAIERLGIDASACAGHSLGEYTALVASGALAFEDGVHVVSERGEAMQDAADCAAGTMAALVGISDDDAEAACQRAEGDVWVANYNAPNQAVIAGSPEAVATASEIARSLGARKTLPIPVGGAFHTPLMAPARHRLRKCLAEVSFRSPEIPVIANVDARLHPGTADWPALLSAQLCSPVRWHQTLGLLDQLGASALIEVGPGGVLSGLARRTLKVTQAISVAAPDDLDSLLATLAGDGPPQPPGHPGEHLYVSERLVVSPASGLFEPTSELASDARSSDIGVGGLIGTVAGAEVRSPFAGSLMGLLVLPGERVTCGEPLAWLRGHHPEATGPKATGPKATGPEATGPEATGPEGASSDATSPETADLGAFAPGPA